MTNIELRMQCGVASAKYTKDREVWFVNKKAHWSTHNVGLTHKQEETGFLRSYEKRTELSKLVEDRKEQDDLENDLEHPF